MTTCYIIDDDIHSIESIIKYIVKIPNLILIGSNVNPLLALDEIRHGKRPDIVFLDVEMPELSGIDVAELLDPKIGVVFTTSHSKYALNAIQKDAMDFLLKPFSFEMFVKCVNKVRNKISILKIARRELSDTEIFVNPGIKGKIIQIKLADIIYIEAIEHSVCIHLPTDKIVTNLGIRKIQERLPSDRFIRAHRTFIVNISHIKTIETNQILLINNIKIPLGDAYRNDLMSKIQN